MSWRYAPYISEKATKSNITIAILGIGLITAIAVIIYQRYRGNHVPPTSAASRQGTSGSVVGFASFLSSLKTSDAGTKRAHQDFYHYLSTLDAGNFPTPQELNQLVQAKDLPYDYAFFFKECLPAYSRSLSGKATVIKDPNILVSIPANATYKASLYVNTDNLPMEAAYNAVNPQASENRIVISGAYTSPTRVPAGLTVDKGRVVNPAIQDFDGIIEIWPDGKLQLTHINALQNNLKSLHIRSSFADYLEFMKATEQNGLTVLQSNLLLNNGDVLVKEDPQLKKLQRRVLFQTADDSIHIYDSLDKEQSLYETAQILKERYKAQTAVNLETGSYSFCTINRNNKLSNKTNAKPGTIISNFLIIDF